MKEIKFRAWDKKQNEMLQPFTTEDFFSESEMIYNSHDNCIFMQFTGLLDKNGKEIYEGDILGRSDRKFIVKWDNVMACFKAENYKDAVDTDLFNWGDSKFLTTSGVFDYPKEGNCEIIGNIYSNPELLANKEK